MNRDLQRLAVEQDRACTALQAQLHSALRRSTHLYGEKLLAMDSISCSVMYLQAQCQHQPSINIIRRDYGMVERSTMQRQLPIEYTVSHRQ